MSSSSFSYPQTDDPIRTVITEDRAPFHQVLELSNTPTCDHSFSPSRPRQVLGSRPKRCVTQQRSADASTVEPLEQLSSDHVERVHRQNDSHPAQWQSRPARTQGSATHRRNVRERPHIGPGLPTSYDHSRNRSLSSSSSDTSPSPRLFPRSLKLDYSSPSSTTMAETRAVEKGASLPGLSPSPSLIFVDLKDWPRPHYRSHHKVGSHSTSISSTGTFVGSDFLREASDCAGGHSRAFSQSFSVSNASATEACWTTSIPTVMVEEERRGRSGRGEHGDHLSANQRTRHQTLSTGLPADTRSRRFSTSRSHPDLPAAAAQPSDSEQHNWYLRPEGPSTQYSARQPQAPLVTTELISSAHYLEPYNSCEAIMLPRPRLRSHSLDGGPSIVVERVHALPERFMQINEARTDGGTRLVPRSSMVESRSMPTDLPRVRSDTQLGSLQPPKRDPRLSLHANIPPPLPPRDSPLPSSGLLPLKSLPATPRPPTPGPDPTRDSSESLEQLEAPELLQRNLQLDRDRQAWREQHRTSLGASIGPMIGRLSPCLRVPSPVPFTPSGQAEPAMRAGDASPIQVHRLRNQNGAEQTLLVVQQAGHPYAQRASSISSPDLPKGQSEGKHRMHRLSLLTQKFGGLTSRKRERGAAAQRVEPTSACIDQQPAAASAVDVGRPIGRGRKLVTDETVVIGRPPEPARKDEAVQTEPWNGHEEVQLGEAVSGPALPATYPASPSRYRPAGTRDEIKAQLGEHLPWLARRSFRMGGAEASEGGVTWYDPGSSSVLRSGAGVPHQLQHSVDTEEAFPSASPSSSSIATSRSNSNGSLSTSEHRPPPRGLGSGDDAERGRRPMEGLAVAEPHYVGSSEPFLRPLTADTHSSVSNRDTALWEAGSVDIEDLFFRPPQRGVS